jgi:single-strand DNA-binding protein
MQTYTKATVIGHIGNEVVMRHTKGGTAVVNLSVATNERRKDGLEVTTWHRAVLWDKLAEYAGDALKKGEAIYLEGRIRSNDWVDQEGIKRSRTEIVGRKLIRLRPGAAAPRPDDLPLAVSRSTRSGVSAAADRGPAKGPSRSSGYSSRFVDRQVVARSNGGRADDGEERGEVVEDIPF